MFKPVLLQRSLQLSKSERQRLVFVQSHLRYYVRIKFISSLVNFKIQTRMLEKCLTLFFLIFFPIPEAVEGGRGGGYFRYRYEDGGGGGHFKVINRCWCFRKATITILD